MQFESARLTSRAPIGIHTRATVSSLAALPLLVILCGFTFFFVFFFLLSNQREDEMFLFYARFVRLEYSFGKEKHLFGG